MGAILKTAELDSDDDTPLSSTDLDDDFADLIATMDISPVVKSPRRSGSKPTRFDQALEETWEAILSDDEDKILKTSEFTKILLRDIEST